MNKMMQFSELFLFPLHMTSTSQYYHHHKIISTRDTSILVTRTKATFELQHINYQISLSRKQNLCHPLYSL